MLFWVCFGITFGLILGVEKCFRSDSGGFDGSIAKGGVPIITSGLGLSWVVVPLGPWSLQKMQRGPGWELVTPCPRSAVEDNCMGVADSVRNYLMVNMRSFV